MPAERGEKTDRYKLLHELTPSQTKALEALDAGWTHSEAAAVAGVDRTTVSRWATRHPAFIAELNRRKRDRAEWTQLAVIELTMKAVRLIEESLDSGDLKTALHWTRRTPTL